MKQSIAKKIERLLAAMRGSDPDPEEFTKTAFRKEESENPFSSRNIGKFCRRIPVNIMNFIRPHKTSGI